jgi:serpin B
MSRTGAKWGGFTLVIGLIAVFAYGINSLIVPGSHSKPAKLPPTTEADMKAVADSNNRFALDLYGKLKEGGDNLFYSPYSISTALAMTYAGARGRTAEQMAGTLHLELPADRLHPACAGLIASLNEAGDKGGFQLHVANRLWGQKGETFLPEFITLTDRLYRAPLSELDFARDPDAARTTINGWVEQQTERKIKDLIQKSDLTPATLLVLTNAIYMKADWVVKFEKQATADAPFFAPGGREIKVPTMHRTDRYGYGESGNLQLLEMPYKGERLAMVVVLPREKDGLADLEKGLTREKLGGWLESLKSQRVKLSLPKFKATRRFRLADALVSLGMSDAFRPGVADFSGMNGKHDLFISSVIHMAFVSVDEEGTEAAAATAVGMAMAAAPIPEEIPEFRADHPFVFLIRDRQTGAILFMGRVTDPKSE